MYSIAGLLTVMTRTRCFQVRFQDHCRFPWFTIAVSPPAFGIKLDLPMKAG
jgi:hypothetical protein